jgi:hypothetical protein
MGNGPPGQVDGVREGATARVSDGCERAVCHGMVEPPEASPA